MIFHQVHLCKPYAGKEAGITSSPDPPVCPLSITVPLWVATLQTSNTVDSSCLIFWTLYKCNHTAHTASLFCLTLCLWELPILLHVVVVCLHCYIIFHCMNKLQFVHSFYCWWTLEQFLVGAIMNRAAVDTFVWVFWCTYEYVYIFCWGYIPRSRIAWS